jgi:predicted enzyme related to lactoylglutathione lyase
MKHSVVHLEIPADDVDRAKSFYTQLFGWQFSTSPEHAGYWTVDEGEEQAGHGIGMMARQAPEHGLINYHEVESVAEYAARVEELGGKVIMPKSLVPGMGWFAQCLDTEGNAFALWESNTSAA